MFLNSSETVVVSNNPMVFSLHLEATLEVTQVDGSALDVMYAALGLMASKGLRLNGYPVAGNMRLLRNPYRSLSLKRSIADGEFGSVMAELRYLEDTIKKLENLSVDLNPSSAEDYRVLDMELLKASFALTE